MWSNAHISASQGRVTLGEQVPGDIAEEGTGGEGNVGAEAQQASSSTPGTASWTPPPEGRRRTLGGGRAGPFAARRGEEEESGSTDLGGAQGNGGLLVPESPRPSSRTLANNPYRPATAHGSCCCCSVSPGTPMTAAQLRRLTLAGALLLALSLLLAVAAHNGHGGGARGMRGASGEEMQWLLGRARQEGVAGVVSERERMAAAFFYAPSALGDHVSEQAVCVTARGPVAQSALLQVFSLTLVTYPQTAAGHYDAMPRRRYGAPCTRSTARTKRAWTRQGTTTGSEVCGAALGRGVAAVTYTWRTWRRQRRQRRARARGGQTASSRAPAAAAQRWRRSRIRIFSSSARTVACCSRVWGIARMKRACDVVTKTYSSPDDSCPVFGVARCRLTS